MILSCGLLAVPHPKLNQRLASRVIRYFTIDSVHLPLSFSMKVRINQAKIDLFKIHTDYIWQSNSGIAFTSL